MSFLLSCPHFFPFFLLLFHRSIKTLTTKSNAWQTSPLRCVFSKAKVLPRNFEISQSLFFLHLLPSSKLHVFFWHCIGRHLDGYLRHSFLWTQLHIHHGVLLAAHPYLSSQVNHSRTFFSWFSPIFLLKAPLLISNYSLTSLYFLQNLGWTGAGKEWRCSITMGRAMEEEAATRRWAHEWFAFFYDQSRGPRKCEMSTRLSDSQLSLRPPFSSSLLSSLFFDSLAMPFSLFLLARWMRTYHSRKSWMSMSHSSISGWQSSLNGYARSLSSTYSPHSKTDMRCSVRTVYMCVCVRVSKREREREKGGVKKEKSLRTIIENIWILYDWSSLILSISSSLFHRRRFDRLIRSDFHFRHGKPRHHCGDETEARVWESATALWNPCHPHCGCTKTESGHQESGEKERGENLFYLHGMI